MQTPGEQLLEGIYNQSGTLQSDTSDTGGATSASSAYANQARVRFKPSSAGNYYVRLGTWGASNNGTFRFNVKRDDELASTSTTAFVNVNGSASGRNRRKKRKRLVLRGAPGQQDVPDRCEG